MSDIFKCEAHPEVDVESCSCGAASAQRETLLPMCRQHITALQQQVERLTEELAEARGLIAEIDHFVTAQSNQHPKLLADLAEEP